MAWTTPRTWVTGEIVTAAIGNTHWRDNLNLTAPALVTTKGDIIAATAANATSRLGVTSDNQILIVDSAAVEGIGYFPFTDGARFDGDQLDIGFTPTNYTPDASPAEAADVNDLAAHLKGIDNSVIIPQATQTALEAETNENSYAPPDLIKHSPGVVKAHCKVAADGTLQGNSYNITSSAKDGTGQYTVTIATDFSNSNWTNLIVVDNGGTVSDDVTGHVNSGAAGTATIGTMLAGTLTDKIFHFAGLGDQ